MKKYVTDQAISEYDVAWLCFVQPTSMTPRKVADDLFVKSWKIADVYDKSTPNDGFIEGFDTFIGHNLRSY